MIDLFKNSNKFSLFETPNEKFDYLVIFWLKYWALSDGESAVLLLHWLKDLSLPVIINLLSVIRLMRTKQINAFDTCIDFAFYFWGLELFFLLLHFNSLWKKVRIMRSLFIILRSLKLSALFYEFLLKIED